jgi:nucleoid DNA-binding protein
MTKEQIIRSISEEFKISELESIQFYENVFQYIEGSFRKSKNLNISDFGKFNVIEKTGTDGARVNSVKFSPSKKLATEVNYNYSNLAKILFRDIERNINKERILSLGEENLYREQSTDSNEVFEKYTEAEKDFIEEQVNLTKSDKTSGSSDLEARVRKIEAFIQVIRRFFEEEKLGEVLPKSKTEIVPPQVDYVKRAEDEKKKDDEYKASISALENKIKELEEKFKEAEAKKVEEKHKPLPEEPKAEKEKIELPPIDVVPPIPVKTETVELKETVKQPEPAAHEVKPAEIQDEKIQEIKTEEPVIEETKEPEAESKISDLGNLVIESEYVEEVKVPESFVKPEIIKPEDFSKQVEESLAPPDIEAKIEERLAEIVKEPVKKKSVERDPSTSNIDDLLRTLGTPIEAEDAIEEETIIEHKPEETASEITDEFFIKTEEKPVEEITPVIEEKVTPEIIEEIPVPEIHDEKLPEIVEEQKLPDTPLAGDISDSELHKKVDSLIEEFRTQSSKIKEEDEVKEVEEIKEPEPEIVKQAPPQDIEEAQLSTALSSIFNSILTSENIKQEEVKETPIIKDEVKSLHNEIVKSEKSADVIPPVEEKTEEKAEEKSALSISDIYSSAKSFNDVFERKDENKDKDHADDMKQIREMHEKNDTNGSGLIETNGHNLVETNGHNLTETNGHNLKELSDKEFAEMHGPGLTESGKPHDVRTSKIYTNGNPLKPYGNGNGRNGSSTLNQVLEDNGLNKESKTSIVVIAVIIIIALGLLFFAIFNSGIMGKENPYSKNNGVVKVNETKNEKYFYDNGKDKVFFQTEKGFTIQAGSYKDKEIAISKRKELADKKVDNVRIEELEKDNSTYFRVRIGNFASLEEAKNYSEKF